jgi:hypothetical protein
MAEKQRSFEERLRSYPHLRSRVERLLDLVEDAAGDFDKADKAEQQVIEELRRMGNEILHDWAENKESVKVKEARNDRGKLTGNGKKNSIGTRHTER